jgi:hypothetical protein
MRTTLRTGIGVMAIAMLTGASLFADVRSQEKMRMQFGGALGRMVGMFGGKAAKEGMTSEVAVKGDRKLTRTDDRGQLVDLAEEKVYEIDYSDKSYKVATFAEIRKRMEEAREKARAQMEKSQGNKSSDSQPQKKMAIEVVSKETGEKKAVNGYDTRQVITTVTMHEEGKPIETGGGMVLTMDSWLAPPIAAMKDAQDFDRRYMEKLSGMDAAAMAQQMTAALAMFPGLGEALNRARVEGTKLDGTAMMTTMTVDAVKSPEQMAKESEQQQDSGGGGLGGMLARKMMKKKPEDANAASANRANIMTTNHEVLSVSTDVPADGVAIPAGFKNKT